MVALMKVGRREGVLPFLPTFRLNSKTLHKKNDQKTEVGRSDAFPRNINGTMVKISMISFLVSLLIRF